MYIYIICIYIYMYIYNDDIMHKNDSHFPSLVGKQHQIVTENSIFFCCTRRLDLYKSLIM